MASDWHGAGMSGNDKITLLGGRGGTAGSSWRIPCIWTAGPDGSLRMRYLHILGKLHHTAKASPSGSGQIHPDFSM